MATATESEMELVLQATAGDPEAFRALVEPHLSMFQAGIYRILQDHQDTQDALQEALLTLFRQIRQFQGNSKFSTWAYRVCINEALMFRRSRIRRREDLLDDFLPHFDPDGHHMDANGLRTWDPEALRAVERRQLREKIQEGLGRMSDEQRAVFVLRDLEGMDTGEIAKRLGITRDLVRQRLHRARLGLRGLLDPFVSGVRR